MNITSSQIFCDWLTVKQVHKTEQPQVNNGFTTHTDSEGNQAEPIPKFKSLKGLHGSNCQFSSHGNTVEISFNPSKWNQLDNHFGISLDEAKILINQIAISQGCDPFTGSNFHYWPSKKNIHSHKKSNDGAKITRVDLTTNMTLGNPQDKNAYLKHIQTLEHDRLDKTPIGLNTYFGKFSKRKTICLYDKAKQITEKLINDSHDAKYLKKLAQHIKLNGQVRLEIKFQRMLESTNLQYWNSLTHDKLSQIYIQDIQFMTDPIEQDDLSKLSNPLLSTLLMYMAGYDVKARLTKNTYYKHRKELKEYGYDISNQNVSALKPKMRTITLQVAEMPSWYKQFNDLVSIK